MGLATKIFRILRIADDFIFDNFGPIRVLFIVRNDFGGECLKPIIHEFEKRGNIKISLTHEFEGCCNWNINKEMQRLHKKYFSSEKSCVYEKWHYVFTTDFSNLYFRRHTTLVLTQHGGTYGNGDFDETHQIANYYHKSIVETGDHSLYFTTSLGFNKIMKSYAAKINMLDHKKFFVSGFAKMDQAFKGHQQLGNNFLRAKKRYDPLKKVVIISSTWSEKSLFRTLGCQFIGDICTELGDSCTVFVTGHSRLWSDDTSNLEARFRSLEYEHENLCFLPVEPNTFGLLSSGDIFIGDNSSIFLEYCLIDKPILLFDNPEFRFEEVTTGNLYKSAASCFQVPENLATKIQTLLAEGDQLSEERRKFVDYFLFNQGHAAEYIADTIEKLGRISGPMSESWKRIQKL